MPPRYLSVEGHRECLSSHAANSQDSFKSICIPKTQPKACLGNSWMKLIELAQSGMIQRCNNEMKGKMYFIKMLRSINCILLIQYIKVP